MSEYSLFCNFKKCRTAVTSYAWITSCSHVFCEEHADKEPNLGRRCPACQSSLEQKYDLVRADLNPSEEFKSMVLAGLRPEIIMDIASRAIGFWCHQMYQEKLIEMTKAHQAEIQLNHVEASYETLMVKMKNDLQVENKNYESLKKISDDQARRIQELEGSLNKKNQQLRTIQAKLDIVKRENLSVTLSQNVTSPGCVGVVGAGDKHPQISPRYLDQQSMIHCSIPLTQQHNPHQSHRHNYNHFHHHQQKAPQEVHHHQTAARGNSFNFKPHHGLTNQNTQSSNPFNFPLSKD